MIWRVIPRVSAFVVLLHAFGPAARSGPIQQAGDNAIVVRGTVVTMNAKGAILRNGGVFVRGGSIVATWQGARVPAVAAGAIQLDLGHDAYIFPGLIDLHDHPTFDFLSLWPAPTSQVQPQLGRPLGTEPYANRYQWNDMMGNASPELRRLVDTPQTLLTSPAGLGLQTQVVKFAEVRALLGGETAIEGASDPIADQTLIRNVEAPAFSSASRVAARVQPIAGLSGAGLSALLARMMGGQLDAWIVHLAEGVRDGDRRSGDPFSSRAEFATLRSKGLLTDETVIIHGVGLEAEDFAEMRGATSPRLDGSGDGLGAKLVWSPLSNLLLYGRTAAVYRALAAGVLVSLGTDWGPSGSRNLLDELKVADIALRDARVLGGDRDLVPELSITGKSGAALDDAETALDRTLVEMVTRNPARTVRWDAYVGTLEPGKRADLFVITKGDDPAARGLTDSPYRALIDATEQDVRLVLVNGVPLAGDVAVMQTLKPGDYEVVNSPAGCFQKAVDVTDSSPQGNQTLESIQDQLRVALAAMAGDHPPAGGGPAPLTNTYSALKTMIPGAGALTDAQFTLALAAQFGLTADGKLNMEAVQLSPLLVTDDDFFFHVMSDDVDPSTGLIADDTPPFHLYPSNLNHVGADGNPYVASDFRDRYYSFCSSSGSQAMAAAPRSDRSSSERLALTVTPNPSRAHIGFALDVRDGGPVNLSIYDVAGRRMRTVVQTSLAPGRFLYDWDLSDVSGARVGSGIYFARLRDASREEIRRLVVLP
jgi:cytosine/adenosine deaminase-related metal-dependent hydrolase